MKYKRFIIKKYRAVKDVEVSMKNNLIPIIGVNESGKTSILHAILAFDKYSDTSMDGLHLNPRNRYEVEPTGHQVGAEIICEDKGERQTLAQKVAPRRGTKKRAELDAFLEKGFIITRDLDTKKYSVDNTTLSLADQRKLAEEVLLQMPYLLYFDDFTDRIPTRIKYPSEVIDKVKSSQSKADIPDETLKHSEWHKILEEILIRGTDREINDFISIKSEDERDGLLSDVSSKLNEEIIGEWRKLRLEHGALQADHIDDLSVELDYEPQANGEHWFRFRVKDKSHEGKERYFEVSERSKGFQWFFNFALKLKYNTKYTSLIDGAIYLLDEPGSYLHSSAQEELVKTLKTISENNPVIYCTHAQHLLHPSYININNIKISRREDGAVRLDDFGEYKASGRAQGALTPLYDALHLHVGSELNIRNGISIVTEGITDYYFWTLAMKHKPTLPLAKATPIWIPGHGAKNLKTLISLCIASSERYAVLLDSDIAGKEASELYKECFGEGESSVCIQYHKEDRISDIQLEDLLSDSDTNKLKSLVGVTSPKRAIVALFFSPIEMQKHFFDELDDESNDAINGIVSKLESILIPT